MPHTTTTISMDRPSINSEVSWPVNHVPLRTAIAHIMKYEQLRNVSCTAAQLIPILHSLAQVQEGINDREKVTVGMIKTAFGKMGERYIVRYSDMGVKGTHGSLIVRNGYRSGSSRQDNRERVNDFRYVDTTTVEVNDIAAESDHRLDNPKIQRAMSLPDDVLEKLIAYITKKNKNKKGSKKRKASGSSAGTGVGTQSSACRKRGGSVTSTGTDVTQEDITQEDDPEADAIRDFF